MPRRSASDGVADELYLALWQRGRSNELAALVKDKATKDGMAVEAFDRVHQSDAVLTLRQGSSQLYDGVPLTVESHFERCGVVDGTHKVAALWLGHHAQ